MAHHKTAMDLSDQGKLYYDLYKEEKDKELDLENEEDRESFVSFIKIKRTEFTKLFAKRKEKNWLDTISEYREKNNLPQEIPYKLFNIYIQLIKTEGQEIDFDDFLKIFENKKFKNLKGGISDNLDYLVNNQGGSIFHAISEIISNAADATNPQNVVGRFGRGFFQSLRFLERDNTKIVVDSKKEGKQPFKIGFQTTNKTGSLEEDLLVSTMSSKKTEVGTTVDIQKGLTASEINEVKNYIKNKFRTNKYVKIDLNGKTINNLEEYIYVNGKKLSKPEKGLSITVNEKGIKVVDQGLGMDSEDISTKLLYPNSTTKPRVEVKDKDLEEYVEKEVSFFYKRGETQKENKNGESKKEKTNISLMIGGVIIEDFEVKTSSDIKDFVLEFPSFTYLMENKSDITLTKEVVVSLEVMLEKIHNEIKSKDDKLSILEILGKIVEYLKSRPTEDSGGSKYNIEKILKKTFGRVKEDLEKTGLVVLPGNEKLMQAIGKKDDIVYVGEDFLNLDFRKIPGVKKLENIENQKVNFYSIKFEDSCPFSYIIIKAGILVDEKYLDNKNNIDVMNTLVNLNVDYEIEEDRVFYGKITGNNPEIQQGHQVKKGTQEPNLKA